MKTEKNRVRKIVYVMICLFCVCLLSSGAAASSVKFKYSSVNVLRGRSRSLTYTVNPSDAEYSLSWRSSNTAVASVDEGGIVTGQKIGSAKITLKTDNGKKATITVNVRRPVTSILLSRQAKTLYRGMTYKISSKVYPYNAYNKKLVYVSSNPDVATVSSKGVIKALTKGTAMITAKAKDGSGVYASLNLTVRQRVTKITLPAEKKKVFLGRTYKIEPIVGPESADNKAVTYSSSNKKIASVASDGTVTPVSVGTAVITVKAADKRGASAKVKIYVRRAVSSLKLSAEEKTIYVNETYALKTTVSPSKASDKTLKYVSSDTSIATVSSKGVIKGIAPGEAVITVNAADNGGASAQIKVTIVQTTIKLHSYSLTKAPMKVGGTFRLRATIISSVDGVIALFRSSDESIITVSETGVVKAVAPGSAKVYITSSDGYAKATMSFNVDKKIIGQGLDISYAQGYLTDEVFENLVADNFDFVIIRAGYGYSDTKNQMDERFENNYKRAKKAGLNVGVYHYVYAKTVATAEKEAKQMLKWLNGKQFEYPVVIDIENGSQASLGRALCGQIIDKYCSILEQNGYYTSVYSYAYFLDSKIDQSVLSKYDRWVAHWNTLDPFCVYDGDRGMWQYTSKGKIKGYLGNIDLDVSYINYPELMKEKGLNGF